MFTVTSSEQYVPVLVTSATIEATDIGPLPDIDSEIDEEIVDTRPTIHVIQDIFARQDVRPILWSMLPNSRARIELHRNADAFIEGLVDHGPGVIIVNCRVPAAERLTLLSRLRHGDCIFNAIIIAPGDDVATAVSTMKHGAVDLLTTACDPEVLMKSLDAALLEVEERIARRNEVLAARAAIEQLSRRERTVLGGLVRGWSNKKMAHDLVLSPRTVEIHRANLMQKLGVKHLSEVMRLVYTAGWMDRV